MITAEYIEQLRQLHNTQKWGAGGDKWVPDILRLIIRFKLRNPTVLDYGAGEMAFEKACAVYLPQVNATSYDPGMPGIDVLPKGVFDLVLCSDVLEHVEPQYVSATLKFLAARTGKAAFLNIACTPAKAHLPDGRNAHLVVRPPEWWVDQLRLAFGDVEVIKPGAKSLLCVCLPL